MIRRDTTVARLLEAHPELLEVLAGYHPHFIHLRNRLLRRVMAPRVTVAQAARIAGVDPDDLLTVLRRAAGESEPGDRREHPGETASRGDAETAPDRPVALEAVPPGRRRQLDVREEIRRGEEPFAKIMGAVKALPEDEVLVLRAPFEPIPLYNVLTIVGMMLKIVPFLVWYRVYAPRAGRAPVPTLAQFSWPGAEGLAYNLLGGGIPVLAIAVGAGDPVWIGAAGGLLALGALSFGAALVRILHHLAPGGMRRESADPLGARAQ
jgi:transposase-like protein